jgi:hypothetical protein
MKGFTQIYVQLTAQYTVLMPMEKGHEMWSLYRSGKLITVARELANYTLHSVGEQEFRWEKRGQCMSRGLPFFLQKRKEKSSVRNRFYYTPQNIISSLLEISSVKMLV